ncbi:flagellin [Paenibacillus sp. MER TA 81-3]|uniref:flagellin N-terminal helical domain-containing protein n=1 Tax=Paenibacillus sp. MER TA 81-3 TaxID=2939573 RepID=UPI0025598985|nr:flagellin [Paenibacillus sp. MER TA 81-3]
MSMFINTNVGAINAHRNLGINNSAMGKTMEKLSSGFRINRAADDAAGLAISEKMRFQINGYNQATRNAQDGISMIQTAEGALTEVHSMLQRMNTLANQAATGTYEDKDRDKLDLEFKELVKEIDNIADNTKFNGKALFDGSTTKVGFQVGFEKDVKIEAEFESTKADKLGVKTTDNIKTSGAASTAMANIQSAINSVSAIRAKLGSVQNRLEHTINNLGVNAENLSASESRIRNADMAKEMTDFTRNQILVQAGTAMLAQANSAPQSVLKLLG